MNTELQQNHHQERKLKRKIIKLCRPYFIRQDYSTEVMIVNKRHEERLTNLHKD